MSSLIEIRFEDSKQLCAATQRFSHFYEIPGFVGKILSWDEMDDYYHQKHGSKSWWTGRYAGANLPDFVFKAFAESDLDDLSKDEKKILKLVSDIEGPYYVIMTSDDALYVRDHEIAHGMWYLDKEYKDKAEMVIRDNWKDLYLVREHLEEVYNGNVLVDEVHAYVGVYTKYLLSMFVMFPWEVHIALRDLFDKYVKKHTPRFMRFEDLK